MSMWGPGKVDKLGTYFSSVLPALLQVRPACREHIHSHLTPHTHSLPSAPLPTLTLTPTLHPHPHSPPLPTLPTLILTPHPHPHSPPSPPLPTFTPFL